jgi:hypothetical protein
MSWEPEDDDFSRLFPSSDDRLTPQPAARSRWRLLDIDEAVAALASFLPDDWDGEARMGLERGVNSGVESRMRRVSDALGAATEKWAKGAPFALLSKKTRVDRARTSHPDVWEKDAGGNWIRRRDPRNPTPRLAWERHLVLVIRDAGAGLDWILDFNGSLGGDRRELGHQGNGLVHESRLTLAQTHGLGKSLRPALLAGRPGEVPGGPDEGRVAAEARQALADWDGFLATESADFLFAAWEARALGQAIDSDHSASDAARARSQSPRL